MKKSTNDSRRKLLRNIVATGGVVTTAQIAPTKWVKPVINSVLIPTHAATSGAVSPFTFFGDITADVIPGMSPFSIFLCVTVSEGRFDAELVTVVSGAGPRTDILRVTNGTLGSPSELVADPGNGCPTQAVETLQIDPPAGGMVTWGYQTPDPFFDGSIVQGPCQSFTPGGVCPD